MPEEPAELGIGVDLRGIPMLRGAKAKQIDEQYIELFEPAIASLDSKGFPE
jgi:hypothetical protein